MRRRSVITVLVALFSVFTGVTAWAAATVPSLGSSAVPFTFSGRITDATTGGGIGGMCVDAWVGHYEQGNYYEKELATGNTGPAGYFQVTFDRGAGDQSSYWIDASANCGANGWWQSTSAYLGSHTAANPGVTVANIAMTTNAAGRIVGRVVDGLTGSPLANADVDALAPSVGGGSAVSATDGTFT